MFGVITAVVGKGKFLVDWADDTSTEILRQKLRLEHETQQLDQTGDGDETLEVEEHLFGEDTEAQQSDLDSDEESSGEESLNQTQETTKLTWTEVEDVLEDQRNKEKYSMSLLGLSTHPIPSHLSLFVHLFPIELAQLCMDYSILGVSSGDYRCWHGNCGLPSCCTTCQIC